jgi:hypothetical protein
MHRARLRTSVLLNADICVPGEKRIPESDSGYKGVNNTVQLRTGGNKEDSYTRKGDQFIKKVVNIINTGISQPKLKECWRPH